MGVRHERWKLVLRAVKLIDRIIVELPFLSFHLIRDIPIEDMGGELLRRRLPIQRVFVQLLEILFPPVDNRLLMRRRRVVEFPVVTGDPELFDQAEGGEQFRFVEDHLQKSFFVKEIEVPGTKANQVCEKNDARDYNCDQGREQRFQEKLHAPK